MTNDNLEKEDRLVHPRKAGAQSRRIVMYCLGLTAIAGLGALLGVLFKTPLIIVIGLLPAAVYELIRTKGASTKLSAFLLVGLLAAEIVVILFKIEINLSKILGLGSVAIASYRVPIGDIRIIGAAAVAILSVLLFVRTAGVYTKWLAIVIFAVGFVFIYVLTPTEFGGLFNWGLGEVRRLIR